MVPVLCNVHFFLDYARKTGENVLPLQSKYNCANDLKNQNDKATYETPSLSYGFGQPRRDSGGVFSLLYTIMAKKAKTKDVVKKTIEQTLWDSANELRGNLDAAEYKSVVLGLVFLNISTTASKLSMTNLLLKVKALRKTQTNILAITYSLFLSMRRWEKLSMPHLLPKSELSLMRQWKHWRKKTSSSKAFFPRTMLVQN